MSYSRPPVQMKGYFTTLGSNGTCNARFRDIIYNMDDMDELLPEHDSMKAHPKRISIVLADDHPLLRQALRNVLDQQADFEVVAEVGDGDEVVKVTMELVPDVVIMDISMPKLNGLEATRQIKAKHPEVAILVLTVHGEAEHVLGLLEVGAAGYLTKSVFGEEVVQAIRAVAAGEAVLSAASLHQILRQALRLTIKPSRLDPNAKISARELQILKLTSTGMSNKEIALNLDLSLRTVKGYLADIFSKLGVASRTEAAITSLRTGLLTLDDLE